MQERHSLCVVPRKKNVTGQENHLESVTEPLLIFLKLANLQDGARQLGTLPGLTMLYSVTTEKVSR